MSLCGGDQGAMQKTNIGLRGYVICSLPRSGSNYLCQLLESTDVLGRPREYFAGVRGWRDIPDYLLNVGSRLQWVLQHAVTPNGVCGFKLMPYQVHRLRNHPWTGLFQDLKYVHITRKDLLGQAISLARAQASGSWKSQVPAMRQACYSRAAIAQGLNDLALAEARWQVYFARNQITPLHLTYESVFEAPQHAVDQVAALVGITGASLSPEKITHKIQRDAGTEEWRLRFLAESRDPDRMDHLKTRGPLLRLARAVKRLV
jgi:trehalose 2-sulfotransferase